MNKSVEFIEVKRQQRNIDLSILRAKADVFLNTTKKFGRYEINYRGISLDDI